MEKETLLTGLKKVLGEPTAEGYIGDTGVSVRTLDAYAEALMPTITEESLNDDFYSRHASVVKKMGGQMRHEKSEFIKTFKILFFFPVSKLLQFFDRFAIAFDESYYKRDFIQGESSLCYQIES